MVVTGYAQGGTYAVKFNMNGCDGMIKTDPEEIRTAIDSILQTIDTTLSGYNRKSIVSRFNEGRAVVPNDMFIDIYDKAVDVYETTSGAVDVAAAPLFDIWGFGFKNGRMPDDALVKATLKRCGMKGMVTDMRNAVSTEGLLEPDDMLIDKSLSDPSLNYNVIAQGYSCDLVAEYLYSIGVKDMMVDIGEIYCDGCNPSGLPWTIGIDRPVDGNDELGADVQAVFKVPSGPHGVVTSGNYRKFYVQDGKKYAHTIDPRSGYPVSHNLLSATIVAPDALTADAYATYCMVIGLEASKEFLEASKDLEGCLIYDNNGEFCVWTSSGFILD
jgi:thiamine biosynthesis lipoprotein